MKSTNKSYARGDDTLKLILSRVITSNTYLTIVYERKIGNYGIYFTGCCEAIR